MTPPHVSARPQTVAPSGFVLVRSPLLPWETLTSFGAGLEATRTLDTSDDLTLAIESDRARLTERLRALVLDPAVREAVFVASPSLDRAIEAWLAEGASPSALGVVDALVRYLARMAGRPTPFGLFSGCSVGTMADETHLELAAVSHYRRHTRLDTQYLAALTEALHDDAGLRATLSYRPSSGLYQVTGQLRYSEGRTDPVTRERSYHLVTIERTVHLDVALACAEGGAPPSAIVDAIVAYDPEIERAEAEQFVDSLIESQVLVSPLAPPITGAEPLAAIIDVLHGCGEAGQQATAVLEGAASAIAELDAGSLGHAPARYHDVATTLRGLPIEPELARLFQVDLYKPVVTATLGAEPLGELHRAIALLARIAPRVEDEAMERFRLAFAERYDSRTEGPLATREMVPLAVALDEDIGIGFGESSDPSPLLDGLDFPGDPAPPRSAFGQRETALLRGLGETLRAGKDEWVLDERDLTSLASAIPPPLPDAFAVMTTLAAGSEAAVARGDFRLVVPFISGPSGAISLGRFCHGDAAIRRAVEAHVLAEQALRPRAAFAEIVHLPEGRMGNVLCRPVLRSHEIPFLGRSGAAEHLQLRLEDLHVTLWQGRVLLWSRRLGCEVIPRLTSAHNFVARSLSIYRFLCSLQGQGRSFRWSWGPLANAAFLPRVREGRIVLALARWTLDRDDLAPLGEAADVDLFRAVQRLRARRSLPRWVALVDLDSLLPVDLDNVLSAEAWARLVRRRHTVTLQEMLGEEDLVVRGPEGRFVHELVVPFVRVDESAAEEPGDGPSTSGAGPRTRREAAAVRTFAPGSEWLYAKLFTGTATADAVLAELVRPLLDRGREVGAFDRWFFLRYADPGWHLRVRFHGDPARLTAEAVPLLHELAAPLLADGRVWRFELSTYERELERYGGGPGIELAELLFDADSDAVLAIVEQLDPEAGADARWRLALRGCHLLLTDLGFDLAARLAVVRRLREAFGAEHRVDKPFEGKLGMRFRPERAALEALLAAPVGGGHELDSGFEALSARSERLRPIVDELRARDRAGELTIGLEQLAASFLHMHCNRLLRAGHRMQELVLYDLLLRLYESEAARRRASTRS